MTSLIFYYICKAYSFILYMLSCQMFFLSASDFSYIYVYVSDSLHTIFIFFHSFTVLHTNFASRHDNNSFRPGMMQTRLYM